VLFQAVEVFLHVRFGLRVDRLDQLAERGLALVPQETQQAEFAVGEIAVVLAHVRPRNADGLPLVYCTLRRSGCAGKWGMSAESRCGRGEVCAVGAPGRRATHLPRFTFTPSFGMGRSSAHNTAWTASRRYSGICQFS